MIANTIIAHVFLQASLHQVDVAAMEQLVTEYPYFSAARLLLARKIYHQHGDLQDPAIKKAMLYSGQPHHFYHIVTHEPVLETVEDRISPVIPADALPDDAPVLEHAAVADMPIAAPAAPETFAEPAAAEAETELAAETGQEAALAEALVEVPLETETEEIPAIAATPAEVPVETETEQAPAVAATPVETEAAPVDTPMEAEMPVATATNGLHDEATAVSEAILSDIPEPADMLAAPETNHTPHQAATTEATDHTTTADERPIKIFPLEIPTAEETTLTFQPLYTDDYFAYKRLKDPENADELSIQGEAEMKSFTSWLRQIKDNFSGRSSKDWYQQQLHRIYDEEEEPEVSETVERMAMDSITFNNDIVSETLAEIWVRQHQYQQAIRIYQKLSLLNPDKNAYFAQKIQELKSLIDKSKR
ncbi:hypothetical protein [Chitinophaga qingshengii]|uniref:Tetratricopeptide repeat protein n=1 Tax=Chitinophaga qingshengii TaxID=1569794 RepID=A0ABR7TKK3_9BACT|nr:hypothetical protein [Chitinophaga qingshengii]MBC9929954.1 hypothetical protein [Chitinophaga qingshengii]